MNDIDIDQARRLMDQAVDAIKAVCDPDHARQRAEAMRERNPDVDPRVFDLMERAARAENALFLLRLDIHHLANLHPVEVPTKLVRELVSAHHLLDTRDCPERTQT
jgi:hypothetical protein